MVSQRATSSSITKIFILKYFIQIYQQILEEFGMRKHPIQNFYKVEHYFRQKSGNMRKLGLIVLLLLVVVIVWGQNKGAGKILGTIAGKSNGSPIEYASIQLLRNTDQSLVEGTVSDTKGIFSIANVALGDYILVFDFIGFEQLVLPNVHITKEQPTLNIGKVLLETSSVQVEEVIVEGKRSTYTQSIDKKVFSVGDDLTSTSGSVSELMQNIPSLQV